jgi:small subunit ribosomal protein S6
MGHRPKGGVIKMRKYEIMFIVRPNIEEAAKNQLVENFTNVLKEREAEVAKVEELGLKTLAYEINDFRKGYYFLLDVTASNEAVNEFDRLARINEDIIRYIVIKDEE